MGLVGQNSPLNITTLRTKLSGQISTKARVFGVVFYPVLPILNTSQGKRPPLRKPMSLTHRSSFSLPYDHEGTDLDFLDVQRSRWVWLGILHLQGSRALQRQARQDEEREGYAFLVQGHLVTGVNVAKSQTAGCEPV